VHILENFTELQKARFNQCLLAGIEAINSERFKYRVLTFSWTRYYRRWIRKYSEVVPHFFDTEDSNAEVYAKFISGADMFNPAKDEDIDLFLSLYYSRNNVVGYTNPSERMIHVNTKYFIDNLNSREGMADIVNNIIHEYMHKVGYDHSFFNSASRPYSVPYAMGDIAGECTLYLLK
jgi:hypothetical protein